MKSPNIVFLDQLAKSSAEAWLVGDETVIAHLKSMDGFSGAYFTLRVFEELSRLSPTASQGRRCFIAAIEKAAS